MDGLKSYLIAVCSGAILCAILKQIVGNGKLGGGTIKLMSGLFVAICVISPWKDFSLQDLQKYNPLMPQNGDVYIETGKEITQSQIDAIIIEQTQTYILEKANQMGLQVEVRVELSASSIPNRVIITGKPSQIEREALSAFIVKETGVQKEMQIWR